MLNLNRVKVNDIVKVLVDKPEFLLKAGDTVKVVEVGFSKWDSANYADVITENGFKIEIMHNYHDFESITI